MDALKIAVLKVGHVIQTFDLMFGQPSLSYFRILKQGGTKFLYLQTRNGAWERMTRRKIEVLESKFVKTRRPKSVFFVFHFFNIF